MSNIRSCRSRARLISPDPRFCAKTLGSFIEGARSLDPRPLAQIAPLAGLTVNEWLEIENGQTMDFCWEQVLLIAQVLGQGRKWLFYIENLYRGMRRQ